MFTDEQKKLILESIIEKIELPDYAYETATKRYEDLGKWFSRDESSLKNLSPHIFPQGSFRLGTAIRPIDESESYDLDLGCELENGVTMDNCTQKELKTSYIKQELETYRKARGIKNDLEEKHRCWRLEYLDELNFHMDIVPCIPSDIKMNRTVFEAIMRNGEEEKFEKYRNLSEGHFGKNRVVPSFYRTANGTSGSASFWVHRIPNNLQSKRTQNV